MLCKADSSFNKALSWRTIIICYLKIRPMKVPLASFQSVLFTTVSTSWYIHLINIFLNGLVVWHFTCRTYFSHWHCQKGAMMVIFLKTKVSQRKEPHPCWRFYKAKWLMGILWLWKVGMLWTQDQITPACLQSPKSLLIVLLRVWPSNLLLASTVKTEFPQSYGNLSTCIAQQCI